MSHVDEVAILRRRTKAFLNRALDSLEAKDYDVASFLSEQAVQLYLKSISRTHCISTLLTILGKVEKYKNVAKILEIKKREPPHGGCIHIIEVFSQGVRRRRGTNPHKAREGDHIWRDTLIS
jgi:hypothetical protein